MNRFVVASLACTALGAQDELRRRVDLALAQARPALVDHLHAASGTTVRPGELALLVLAAVHDGLGRADPPLAKAILRLARANPSQTYDLALRLMVCELVADFPARAEVAARDAAELLAHRTRTGAFSYARNPSGWDLSNTQYAALGLRAARATGVVIEAAVWEALAREMLDEQDDDGAFGYTPRRYGFGPYASMTAAGIAVVAICRQELGERHALAAPLDGIVQRGWAWFDRHAVVLGSADERWSFYFHYGLERAAILTDVQRIGGVDWYASGAAMLVDRQLRGGGWQSDADGYPHAHLGRGRGDSVPTAFAILFLRRAFQKVAGPITPHIVTLAALGDRAGEPDVAACVAELVRRGKAAMGDVLFALRSDVEPRRRAAARALVAIAGDAFGYDPARDLAANRAAVHRAELWHLRNR